jgi:hypothetical protein
MWAGDLLLHGIITRHSLAPMTNTVSTTKLRTASVSVERQSKNAAMLVQATLNMMHSLNQI